MVPVTSAHVVLFGVLLTGLAINTTRHRLRSARDTSPAAVEALRRASRAHGNTLEHGLPLLLIMLCAELNGASSAWLCAIGTGFIVARLFYTYGMITRPASMPMRIGAGTTYLLELVAIKLLAYRLICG